MRIGLHEPQLLCRWRMLSKTQCIMHKCVEAFPTPESTVWSAFT